VSVQLRDPSGTVVQTPMPRMAQIVRRAGYIHTVEGDPQIPTPAGGDGGVAEACVTGNARQGGRE
jgi:hypothetical protein